MTTRFDASVAVRGFDRMSGPFAKMSLAAKKLRGQVQSLGSLSNIVASSALTAQLFALGGGVFETAGRFEKYNAVLRNALGTQTAAADAMGRIQKFAADTPFSVDELTGSFIKFTNRSMKPTMESMRSFGDLAASQGKSFDQLTEAVLDATSGEFERLKEFGIKASKAGEQVTLTFKGVPKVIKNTPEAIEAALIAFGGLEGVAGGMAAISETWEGTVSNIGDSSDSLKALFGKGIIDAIRPMSNAFRDALAATAAFFGDAESGAQRVKIALLILSPVIGTLLLASILTAGISIVSTLAPAFGLLKTTASLAGSAIGWVTTTLFGNSVATLQNAASQKASMLARKMNIAVLGLERTGMTLSTILYGVATGKITIATAAQWAWNTALAANPIGLIVAGIAILVGVIAALIIYSDEIAAAFVSFWGVLVDVWQWVLSLPGRVVAMWSQLPGWAQGLISLLSPIIAIPMWIVENWGAVQSVPGSIVAAWGRLLAWGSGVYQSARATVVRAGELISEKWNQLKGIPGAILGAWGQLPGWAQGLISLLAPFIGLPLMIADNWDWLTGKLQTALAAFKSLGSLVGLGGASGPAAGTAGAGGGGGRRTLPTGAASAPNVFSSSRTEKSEVKVTFDKLPPGSRVEQDRPASGAEIEYTGLALDGAL